MVQVTVAEPPSHKVGIETEALSFVNTGAHPLAMAKALVC